MLNSHMITIGSQSAYYQLSHVTHPRLHAAAFEGEGYVGGQIGKCGLGGSHHGIWAGHCHTILTNSNTRNLNVLVRELPQLLGSSASLAPPSDLRVRLSWREFPHRALSELDLRIGRPRPLVRVEGQRTGTQSLAEPASRPQFKPDHELATTIRGRLHHWQRRRQLMCAPASLPALCEGRSRLDSAPGTP